MNLVRFLKNCQGVPALPIMTHPGIEYIGKTVREAVTDGQIHYEAIKALSERHRTAASTVIMDLTVEAEAFGADVVFPKDEIPSVTGRLLNSLKDIEALKVPSLSVGRVSEYLKANRLAAEGINDRPVLAGCIGPFSLAGRLFGMSEIMVEVCVSPKSIASLLEKCTAFLLDYCRAVKATGVDGVIMAEPAAGLLSDDDCINFSTVYVKRIVKELQDDNFTVVLHNCGNTGHCTHAMVESGAHALHFGNKIDMSDAARVVPSDILIMGNLDPVSVFRLGNPDSVRRETARLMRQMLPYRNFIVSSGCDLPPHIPEANIEAFFEATNRNELFLCQG